MADLALVTADTLRVVRSDEQDTKPAAVAVTAGQLVREDTNGKWVLTDADTAADIDKAYLALRTVAAGIALTALKKGEVDGFDLSALAYGANLFMSNTAGAIGTTAGTTSKIVGQVVSAHSQTLGTAPDKLLRVDL